MSALPHYDDPFDHPSLLVIWGAVLAAAFLFLVLWCAARPEGAHL